MAQSKTEKRNSAKKIAEAKSQAKKANRMVNPKPHAAGKVTKGRRPLSTGKRK